MPVNPRLLAAIIAASNSSYTYQNPMAAAWATKLSTPLSPFYAVKYDVLFAEIGDLISTKFYSFGLGATETAEAAVKNLVQDAPDLLLINSAAVNWEKNHGFSQVDIGATTYVDKVGIWVGGSGYTNATITISAPTGAGPVQAVFTAVISDGVIVDAIPVNKGAGYVYTATGGIPSVTITGDGTGARAYAQLYMGRATLQIKPNDIAGISPTDLLIGIGSTKYTGTRGACLGTGSPIGVAAGGATRVSLGTTINTWMGGSMTGNADIGVYANGNTGHYLFRRTLSTEIERFYNGTKLSASSLSINVPNFPDDSFYLFNRRVDDAWKNTSAHSWWLVSKALTDAEITRLYYALNRFLSGIGSESPATVPFSTLMTVS